MESYDQFIRGLDMFLKRGLDQKGAHQGYIGNIYYSHDRCSHSLDNLIPDPYFLHKRIRLVEISKRFIDDFSVLEIGVNAGHSAALFLLANKRARYFGVDNACAYDDGTYKIRSDIYVPDALSYLSKVFPNRVDWKFGNSFDVIEALAKNPKLSNTVDVLHLDAQKDYYYRDFISSLPLLKKGSIVVVDDTTNPTDTARETVLKLIDQGFLVFDEKFPDILSNTVCVYTGKSN